MTTPAGSALQSHQTLSKRAMALVGLLLLVSATYASLLGWRTTDVEWWFLPWMNYIIEHGAKASLEAPLNVQMVGENGFGNYAPPYLYLLIVASAASAWFSSFLLVKFVSIAGVLFCAACIYYVIRCLAPPATALLGAAGLLLLPTVALNGPAWGQTDTIWSGLAALAVGFALRDRLAAMMMIFGVAVAFKLQAVFIAPFLLYVLLSRRAALQYLPLPALTYAGMMLPAWLAGRPAWDLATVYLEQAGAYRWLSMNSPNPWAFVQYGRLVPYELGMALGASAALLATLLLAALSVRARRLDKEDLLLLSVTVAAAMPYVLPKMHERYFFLADVLAYAMAVCQPRPWTIGVATAIQIGSVLAYASHMLDFALGKYLGALFIGAALVILVHRLWLTLRAPRTGMAGSPSSVA